MYNVSLSWRELERIRQTARASYWYAHNIARQYGCKRGEVTLTDMAEAVAVYQWADALLRS